ncbi:hypothetical protein EK21DRAFT_116096 [Setomelanomma holmii]|uniref:Uncharacterized protein n=1 Tax=Setomelanomma holmii TaxID=210430 RepID=A0A9P4H1L8_9PLEO|nr:hypothetical protein EK21DRAFT_116096 [Setomelanomma holmii]
MSSPTLHQYVTLDIDTLLASLQPQLDSLTLYAPLEAICIRHDDLSSAEQRVMFHNNIGEKLGAAGDWNGLTPEQLVHCVRVQGFLGPNEDNVYSDWDLRLKLMLESKTLDMYQELQDDLDAVHHLLDEEIQVKKEVQGEDALKIKQAEENENDDKIILVTKDGQLMRY